MCLFLITTRRKHNNFCDRVRLFYTPENIEKLKAEKPNKVVTTSKRKRLNFLV